MTSNATTRRKVLGLVLGAGTAAGCVTLPGPLLAASAPPLALPDRPLRLDRVFQHTLGDAAAITVRRAWEVWFERQGRGIVVSGRQLMVEVSAPPHLAALAKIEEQRDASDLLPMMLTETGIILPTTAVPGASDNVAAAMRAAEALIARQRVPSEEVERYRHYLAEVHRSGTGLLDTLPPDLLFPRSEPVTRSEMLALPDGDVGSFLLTYTAQPQPDAPWLRRAERWVITRIASFERAANEVWTMGQMGS